MVVGRIVLVVTRPPFIRLAVDSADVEESTSRNTSARRDRDGSGSKRSLAILNDQVGQYEERELFWLRLQDLDRETRSDDPSIAAASHRVESTRHLGVDCSLGVLSLMARSVLAPEPFMRISETHIPNVITP